jgi:hypothetical protein
MYQGWVLRTTLKPMIVPCGIRARFSIIHRVSNVRYQEVEFSYKEYWDARYNPLNILGH